ncbi:MAG TPA: hypothetical protein VE959_25155 [Bryobacteraceae bacterium]|nr:hypothetical protein [Bryobacteraceae bacterium]
MRDCLEAIDKKEWKDAWRPIYEVLRAVEEGSAGYLKRIAVEIRDPAVVILWRIASQLPDLAERAPGLAGESACPTKTGQLSN